MEYEPIEQAAHTSEKVVVAARLAPRSRSKKSVKHLRSDLIDGMDALLHQVAVEQAEHARFGAKTAPQSAFVSQIGFNAVSERAAVAIIRAIHEICYHRPKRDPLPPVK